MVGSGRYPWNGDRENCLLKLSLHVHGPLEQIIVLYINYSRFFFIFCWSKGTVWRDLSWVKSGINR